VKTKILVMAGVIGLLAASFGFAQVDQLIRVNVPFSFVVGKKALPAGEYNFAPNSLNEAIEVTPAKKGEIGADAIVLTQLAAEVHNVGGGHLVFDKVGDTYFLSEIWIPGFDGFLVNATKEKHTHRVIKASKKASK
jgi:hypothetical protein